MMRTGFNMQHRRFLNCALTSWVVVSLFAVTLSGQVIDKLPEIGVRSIPFYDSSKQPDVKGRLMSPAALAIARSGNVYVFDDGNSRIIKLNKNGKFMAEFGFGGSPEETVTPGGLNDAIAVDSSEHVYVADAGNPRILVFNSDGSFVRSFRVPFVIDSLAVNSVGEIFVAVEATRSIPLVYVFSNSGSLLRMTGERIVSAEGRLSKEVNRALIAIDSHDNLLMTFRHWPLIRKYSRNGRLLGETSYKVPAQLIPESQRKNYSLDFIAKYPNASYVLPLLAHSISMAQATGYLLLNGHAIVKFNNNKIQILKESRFRESEVPSGSLFTRLQASAGKIYLLDTRSGRIFTVGSL